MALEGPQGYHPDAAAMTPREADRGRVVELLAAAFAEGRIDGAEHRHRVEVALATGSYPELSSLTADLPSGPLPIPSPYAPYGPYPMPPYGYAMYPPYGYPPSRPVDGCAIASLICAIITPVTWYLFGLPTIAALICGHIALARSGRYGSGSRGMAIAGLVIGYIEVLVGVLIVTLIVLTSGD